LEVNDSISVALCTYNGERYLSEQLESIANQTLLPSELVVCDDGSKDGTADLVAAFARSAPFPVRFVRNDRNLGSTRNFEQAIRLCEGSFIALCDQDDWWDPQKLETLTNALRTSGAGGAFSDALLMDDNSALTGTTLWEVALFSSAGSGMAETSDRDRAIRRMLRGNMVTGATLVFRSALRPLLLPFPELWIHDGWIAWMLVLKSGLVACDQPLIRYRIHASQQVGMPGLSWRDRLRRGRATGAQDCRLEERRFSELLEYARSHPGIGSPDLCRRIDEKRRHAAFRAELKPAKWARWREIALRSSAYRHYSYGWRSMLKDALL
jgi:glycosyltransferase involved in cell wall biosynthesis